VFFFFFWWKNEFIVFQRFTLREGDKRKELVA